MKRRKLFSQEKNVDVLVIGGGIAGIRAAAYASSVSADNDVLLVTKGVLGFNGSSFYPVNPGWGFQAAKDDEVEKEYHLQEILKTGQGMVNPDLAQILVDKMPDTKRELKKIGLEFTEKKIQGDFSERARAYSVFNRENIKKVFTDLLVKNGVEVWQQTMSVKLLKHNNKVRGSLFIDKNGDTYCVNARVIIMATGGYTGIYKHHLNSPDMTGDGYWLSIDVGCRLANIEYTQFILGILPDYYLFPQMWLSFRPQVINSEDEIVLRKYFPGVELEKIMKLRSKQGPYTTSDISKVLDISIFKEMKNQQEKVFVDLGDISSKIDVENEYFNWLQTKNIDIENKMQIAPCAHATNGGIVVGENCETDIDNLFATGEIMAGPHGADRLGGNMMSAVFVFSKVAGLAAGKRVVKERISERKTSLLSCNKYFADKIEMERERISSWLKEESDDHFSLQVLEEQLREIMWEEVGIIKTSKGLKKAKQKIEKIIEIMDYKSTNMRNLFYLYSLNFAVKTAKLIINSSQHRKESRGPHFRKDFPTKREKFNQPIMLSKINGTLKLSRTKF